ncbi:hypothetical protein XH79_19520 [Bradyrhizobium sp. CCBAU 45389]|nr:hypothetical protein [Bradyrhizobium sp. CCBAU 45389]
MLHLVMPGLEVAREAPRPRETVTAFLRRTGWARRDRVYGWQFRKGLPTILEINGEPVLRKNWSRRRIVANDNVHFVSYPLGGAGGNTTKQVIGLVALIAVAAFAAPLGGVIAGAMGLPGAAGLIGAGLALGGSLCVNNVRPITIVSRELRMSAANLIVASDGVHLVSDALVWDTSDQTITAICPKVVLLPQFRCAATIRAEQLMVFQSVSLALSTMPATGFDDFKHTVGGILHELDGRLVTLPHGLNPV